MSDEATTDTPDEPQDDNVDLTQLTESELRARHAELSASIESERDGELTPARALQINQLREQRNEVVRAVNALTTFEPVADEAIAEAPAEAAEAADSDTSEATAAEDTSTEETAVDTPDQGDSDIVAAAEAIAEGASPEMAVVAGARPTAPAVPTRPRTAYVAGAGQRQFSQGYELDFEGLARAWDSRKDLRPGPDGAPEQAIVANLPGFDSTEGLSISMLHSGQSTLDNDRLIAESVAAHMAKRKGDPMTAHVAAICEPLDIIREIPECGEVDTPFTNSFPGRPIGRLGFTFTRAGTAASTDGAIKEWAQSDQDSVDEADPSTWKPCIPITCATPDTVTAEEFTTCVSVDSSTEMSSPERVKDFMHKLRVQRARRREQVQLTAFDATASGYTFEGYNGYGSIPTLVAAVEQMMPQLAYPERLDETDWDIFLEPGLCQKLTIDRHNIGNPAEMAAAREETIQWLRSYLGRSFVELRDFKGSNPFQAIPDLGQEDPLEDLPAVDRIRFVPTMAYIYGSTGEESTGWQTDPQLVRQNKKQAFTAEWHLLAKHGCHPAAYIDLTNTPDGGRAGLVTPFGSSDYTS